MYEKLFSFSKTLFHLYVVIGFICSKNSLAMIDGLIIYYKLCAEEEDNRSHGFWWWAQKKIEAFLLDRQNKEESIDGYSVHILIHECNIYLRNQNYETSSFRGLNIEIYMKPEITKSLIFNKLSPKLKFLNCLPFPCFEVLHRVNGPSQVKVYFCITVWWYFVQHWHCDGYIQVCISFYVLNLFKCCGWLTFWAWIWQMKFVIRLITHQ